MRHFGISSAAFRALSVMLCLLLGYSSAAAGLHATGAGIYLLLMSQLRPPHFSDSPRAIQFGDNPKREDSLRGGQWTLETLQVLKRAAAQWSDPNRGLIASTDFEANLDTGYPGDEGAGDNNPWEGEYVIPIAHWTPKLNTQTGNVSTPFPVTGWASRGDVGVGLTLYHNSKSTYFGLGVGGWSHSYDAHLVGFYGSSVVLRWGDGTSHVYSFDDASGLYNAPTGVFDKLTYNGAWTLTKPDQTKVYLSYPAGRITSIKDRSNNQITVSETGGVMTVTDPTGRALTLTKTDGKLTGISDFSGRTWSMIHGSGTVEFKQGTTTLWSTTHGPGGRISSVTDGRRKTWTYGYVAPVAGATEYLGSITSPLGYETEFEYTATSCTIKLPGLQTLVHNYSSGKLVSEVDEAGFSASYAYGAHNLVTGVTDERGKLWQFTYDARGNVLTAKNPLNQTWTYTYNTLNDLLTAKDPLNNQTTLIVNGAGNVLTVTDPLSRLSATNSYDAYGQIVTTEDALDRVTTIGRNANGDVTTVTDPLNKTWTYNRDTIGRLTSVKDPLNNETVFAYDSLGRPNQLVHPGGAQASVGYDLAHNVIRATNELGRDTLFAYDDEGKLTSVTNPRGDVEEYTYSSNGWLINVEDGNSHIRAYGHTPRGEVSSLLLADGTTESWTYDATGNPTAYTNPIAQQIQYGYDDPGRLVLVNYPTGADTAFTYDTAGRPNTMTDDTGVTDWDFNAASEVTKLTTPQGIMDYTYTLAGERATMVEQGVGTTSYQYWNDGRLKQLTNPYSETTIWNYDSAGRNTKRTLGSGIFEAYNYDVRSRLSSANVRKADNTLLRYRSYGYDAASNVLTQQIDSTVTTYAYDLADQLLSENRTGHSTSYSYDSNGNRLTRTVNGLLENYNYDAGDKLTSVSSLAGNKNYTYEAGRVKTLTTGAGTTTFNYDYEGRVTGITYATAATNSFAYNGLGSRTTKTDSTGTRTYKRDGAYVTDPVLSDGAANYTPAVSEKRAGTTTYLHSGLKNADAQSASNQSFSGTKAYDAFGASTAGTGTWQGPFSYAGGFGYQGDSDSGLMLLGNRYYESSTGRFLSRDPIQNGSNWYTYVQSNPITDWDPEGFHGNVKSDAFATLYKLVTREGDFLKWGVAADETTRYRESFLGPINAYTVPVAQGTRREMLRRERLLEQSAPGRLNNTPWANKAKAIGKLISTDDEATKAYRRVGRRRARGWGGSMANALFMAAILRWGDPFSKGELLGEALAEAVDPYVQDRKAQRRRAAEIALSTGLD